MFERIHIKQLSDHLWLMDDSHKSTGYLIVGAKKALMVDTMHGFENPRAIAETLTDRPVTVINTHGHCDHVLGNVWFDEALIEERDIPLVATQSLIPVFANFRKEHGLKMPPFRRVHDGDTIDLGGLTAEVISLPGHTAGSICILLREDCILFTGDSISRHLWMQLEESLSLQQMLDNLDRITWVRTKADRILHGHARGFEDISLFDRLRQCLRELCEQSGTEVTDCDSEYPFFGGKALRHDCEGVSVIYTERQLKQVDMVPEFAAMEAFCGQTCTSCDSHTSGQCEGCKATNGQPFHTVNGETCALAACCLEKGIRSCADCGNIPCEKLTRFSNDPQHGDVPRGTRIEQLKRLKTELLRKARRGHGRIAACGLCCGEHCFLGEWCGGCRSEYNCCSFATVMPDGVCPNVKCVKARGIKGCWECPELEACKTGFYGIDDANAVNLAKAGAMFIGKYSASLFVKVLTDILRKEGVRYDQFITDKSDTEKILDSMLQAEAEP